MKTDTPVPMTPKDAWLYAASWGSFMHNGDPGAVMYGFDENFRVQSEEHRVKVREQIAEARQAVETDPGEYDDDELVKMDSFLAALDTAPLEADIAAAEAESRKLLEGLDEFTVAYIVAALWNGVEYPEGHEFHDIDKDSSRQPHEIDADTLRGMIADCVKFLTPENIAAIEAAAKIGIRASGASPMAQAGHDFWFTRTGAGVGFWDGDWPEPHAKVLDTAARKFGEDICLYLGDDGRVHE